jgi:hypothetical protein
MSSWWDDVRVLARRPSFPIVSGIVALMVYATTAWFILSPHAVWSPDEGAKLLQIQSLSVHDGHLAYDIPYPGRALDPGLRFAETDSTRRVLRARDNRLYFQRLPLFPLLALPAWTWFGTPGIYILPALGGALSSTLMLYLVPQERRRILTWALVAFGSPLFIYSTIFWEHTLATSLGLIAACAAVRITCSDRAAKRHQALAWAGVGVSLGLSVYIRLEMAIFALALLLATGFVARDSREGLAWAGSALLLILLPYVPLHQALFEQPVGDNALYLFYPLRYLADAGWHAAPALLVGPFADEAIDAGWRGVLWTVSAMIALGGSFIPSKSHWRKLYWVGLGLTALVGSTFLFAPTPYRSAHGLLFTTPWALLGLCRALEIWRQGRRGARIIALTTVLGLLGYAIGLIGLRGSKPHGGLEWGARFAMTFYPLLALCALWVRGEQSDHLGVAKTLIVGALVMLGFGFQVRGIKTIAHDKRANAALNQTIAELPESPVVSDLWWLRLNAAPIYREKQFFITDTSEELAEWLDFATLHQVERFALVTLNEALLREAEQLREGYQLSTIDAQQAGNLQVFQLAIASGE